MHDEAVGTIQFLADYELREKVGTGGMCDVYRGRKRDSDQIVAIKVLPARTGRNEVLLRRFEQEFHVARRLDHPHIVRALDFCLDAPTPYLVMEFVEGVSLGEKLERGGMLSEAEAIRLICQVCDGLEYAHSCGVVHRDIKPDNLLVTSSGDVKIADFGLVKELLSDRDLTRAGRGLGTPHFMAPEQFRDARSADARADVYSLGATLYTMVTATLPFAGTSLVEAWARKKQSRLTSPRSIVPSLSLNTESVILRAMSADPALRPQSPAALAQELQAQSSKPEVRGDAGESLEGRLVPACLAAAVLVMAAVAGVVYMTP